MVAHMYCAYQVHQSHRSTQITTMDLSGSDSLIILSIIIDNRLILIHLDYYIYNIYKLM